MNQPLKGVKVVDLSTLLPGPLCTLLLAEAGADVVKVERPAGGDEMRSYVPKAGTDSVNFGMLNRGKRSVALDLKSVAGREAVLALIDDADVLVEQFRPGVMARLGLGYEQVAERNPRVIYCSITGYGQSGPKAGVAAHDLNYLAETGMLALSCDPDGAPVLPPALIADIGGGAYPAVINILLALKQRDATGKGCRLDISMADNLFTFMYWALGNGTTGNGWPTPGGELVTGGTARYQIYKTLDAQYLAAAPLEEKFWRNFTEVIGAPELATKNGDEPGVKQRVAQLIAGQTADTWLERFAGTDTCTVRVVSLEHAVTDPHFAGRRLFDRKVRMPGGQVIDALPVPIVEAFRGDASSSDAPALRASVGSAGRDE
ncbi:MULTISPECIES: CaiB/BaiF CoA-transferase family protein [Burkholderia]|uniref:L-carnitine dehydratase n=1 Tax=Burkholderia diffusa TaxID=488732 RepID=A0A6P2PT99_9BURK|nr:MULTISPECIES: CoA transferase [Burkholderia]KAB0662402.1 CoA transferase [Burkholderia diffusa]MBM2655848.1 CoA transferase [Burkholderia diffusa]RQZ59038.1 CoA transferase [Burkholderia sp. Bp9004]VWC10845.1 L-carnitine dehydratase [Burkholderia diffusa]